MADPHCPVCTGTGRLNYPDGEVQCRCAAQTAQKTAQDLQRQALKEVVKEALHEVLTESLGSGSNPLGEIVE